MRNGAWANRTARSARLLTALLIGLTVLAGPVAAVVGGASAAPPPAVAALPSSEGAPYAGPLFPPPALASPAVTSGSSVFYVGAQAPTSSGGSYLTNAGAQTTIEVVSQSVTGCLSYWIGDDSAANLWGQVGYYVCNGATPIAFYQVWNLTSGTTPATGTTSVSTGYHTFSLYAQSGGSVWAFALDGTVFGTYNLGAGLSKGTYPVQAVSEEGMVSGPWVPAQVTFSTAIQTYQTANTNPVGSGWIAAASAFEPWGGCAANGTANNTGGYTCWGIAGNLQDATVPSDALVVGGTRTALAAGTSLWNGATSDFSLAATPASVTVAAGVAGTSTVTVAPIGSFTGTVSLAASVSPSTGLACTLTPSSVSGGSGSSTLSCSGSAGTYTVTVSGTSGARAHSTAVAFDVVDFGLAASPTSLSLVAGATGTSTITVTALEGFAGTVTLASSVTPSSGLGCTLSPTSLAGSGTSTLSCTGSVAGNYSVTVTGTSGSLTHSATITVAVSGGPVLTFSFSVSGGGSGYTAPILTYVQGGAQRTATLTASPTAYQVDPGSAWSVTNPLSGSSSTERWQTAQSTSGAATAPLTLVFDYDHQYLVTFGYSVLDGGTGYSAPTVGYTTFGAATTTATGISVWADAGTAFAYPDALLGSGSSEAWRTANPSGTVSGSASLSAAYYHQFSITFSYAVLDGGSGYAAPTVATTRFGLSVSVGAGAAAWVDANAAYAFTNPLGGSGTGERWISPAPSGVASASGTMTASYYHQFQLTFSFTVVGGGTGYVGPAVTYVSFGATSSTTTGVGVWADGGTGYAYTNPLTGSSTTAAWRAAAGGGTVTAAGTLSATYYYQYVVAFLAQVVNSGSLPGSAALTATMFGSPVAIPADGSSWADAGGAYAFPATFAGATGERWESSSPPSGTITQAETITALYYHQVSVTFGYSVSGGGTGFSAPAVSYVALGSGATTTAGGTLWADTNSAYRYAATLPGSSSTEQWLAPSGGGSVYVAGTVLVAYVHQFWTAFTYVVKGGGTGYSAPSVAFSNLSASASVLAVSAWVWVDAGTPYTYQNPLPGSTSTSSWRTNNGVGTASSSTTDSATYRLQYKVKFKTTTLSGGTTVESPLVNVTVFGSNLSLPADNVSWVDAGSSYSFPGVFYGPLPGERWITSAPASGLVLAPLNITAAYAHQYFLAIQINDRDGGNVSGLGGWYNATAALSLEAQAQPGWRFQEWIGSGTGSYSGTSPTATVVMDEPVTETAVFDVGITLSASGGGALQYAYGGTSGWVPAGATETLYLTPGTALTLSAAPSLFYQLDRWSGATAGTGTTVLLVANAPQTVSASFGLNLYSRADSLLGIAVLSSVLLGLGLAMRRHWRRKKERALRMMRVRARARA